MRARFVSICLVSLGGLCSGCSAAEVPVPGTDVLIAQVSTSTTEVSVTVPATAVTPIPETTALPTSTTTTAPLPPLIRLAIEVVASGFDQPVFVTPSPDGAGLLVVEREGLVKEVDQMGTILDQPFLDLTDVVGSSSIEQGLLGLAFHPTDASRLFIYYTLPSNDSVLVEFPVEGSVPTVEHGIELLRFEQPTERHNAGMIQFGPDGYLYLSLGEGGEASTHAQDPNTLLSSILRLDVDDGVPYGVPSDNPFVGGGGAPEVWAYGLRNPWRFAIDEHEGLVYIADVGHSDWEEVNVVPLDGRGYNFGWLIMEASHCFSSSICEDSGLEVPVIEYPHSEGCSVTGGYVYRGSAIPEIEGNYFYGDWCTGFIRSFRYEDGAATDIRDWSEELGFSGQVNSFGLDGAGELLIATWDGVIYRLVPVR